MGNFLDGRVRPSSFCHAVQEIYWYVLDHGLLSDEEAEAFSQLGAATEFYDDRAYYEAYGRMSDFYKRDEILRADIRAIWLRIGHLRSVDTSGGARTTLYYPPDPFEYALLKERDFHAFG